MNGDSNTSMNNPLNIPSSEEIMRVVDKKLGELNDASENANNKWAFAASAAAATEIFAAKKMEKAKCAFDDANRKAQIAAEEKVDDLLATSRFVSGSRCLMVSAI